MSRREIVKERRRELRRLGVSPKNADRIRYWSDERYKAFVKEYKQEQFKEQRKAVRNARRREQYRQARELGLSPKQASRVAGLKKESFQQRLVIENTDAEQVRKEHKMSREAYRKKSVDRFPDQQFSPDVINLVAKMNYEASKMYQLSWTYNPAVRKADVSPDDSIGWYLAYNMLVKGRSEKMALELLSREISDYTKEVKIK